MSEHYKIAIIGAGPGGLSAGARAAALGVSHIVLEASPTIAKTISQYQKGKHVMCEPGIIPLRSELDFSAGTRESILDVWASGADALSVNLRYNAEVQKISGCRKDFKIELRDGVNVNTEYIVLAIGVQGNLRRLGISGEDYPVVQYQLDDPDEYFDENIVVIGAGDAAIENAIALATHNDVVIVNRRDEFARAKQGNLTDITKAIETKLLDCAFGAVPKSITEIPASDNDKISYRISLETSSGAAEFDCDRVIARLGATPPRAFLTDAGVELPSDDPAAVPALSIEYESNVPGLYIIGALAGYPLIKQCMNQGYEVVEYIEGRHIDPVDQEILWEKLRHIPGVANVDEAITRIQASAPIVAGLTRLQIREFLLDSDIVKIPAQDIVFEKGDYTNSFYSILDGEVKVEVGEPTNDQGITLKEGDIFGEISLISGRRRSARVTAASDCVLVETPKRAMTRLVNSDASARKAIDEIFLSRVIAQFAPQADPAIIDRVVRQTTVEHFAVNEVLFAEGDSGDCLFLIRSGSLVVSRHVNGKDITFAYVPAGHFVGEMALLSGAPRSSTVRAASVTEVIKLTRDVFSLLLESDSMLRERIRKTYEQRAVEQLQMVADSGLGDRFTFLVNEGVGEATDVLLIDEALCIRCDQCEKACAGTHEGQTRLNRTAGPSFDYLHLPTSCRHCEHPHCMKDCPPDAISRAPNGEVFISDSCIGCGNCEQNCPYGVIHLTKPGAVTPSLWKQLLFDTNDSAEPNSPSPDDAPKKAVKCDMCVNLAGGPACVRACPTGAAIRMSPEEFLKVTA